VYPPTPPIDMKMEVSNSSSSASLLSSHVTQSHHDSLADYHHHHASHLVSVARWYIFKPKISNWVNFGRSCNGRCWYFYGHFVYFRAKWYILSPFCTFCGHLVYFSSFGKFYRDKSGKPMFDPTRVLSVNYGRNWFYKIDSCRRPVRRTATR
jgi:hypothetical protein